MGQFNNNLLLTESSRFRNLATHVTNSTGNNSREDLGGFLPDPSLQMFPLELFPANLPSIIKQGTSYLSPRMICSAPLGFLYVTILMIQKAPLTFPSRRIHLRLNACSPMKYGVSSGTGTHFQLID